MVDFINLEFDKKDIIYDSKARKTYNGQGIIRLKDSLLGYRAYIIFPIHRKDMDNSIIVAVDEILNKGIHPDNDHTSRILLDKKYVGRKCLVVLQEG